jgi:hypothetical protein
LPIKNNFAPDSTFRKEDLNASDVRATGVAMSQYDDALLLFSFLMIAVCVWQGYCGPLMLVGMGFFVVGRAISTFLPPLDMDIVSLVVFTSFMAVGTGCILAALGTNLVRNIRRLRNRGN